MNAQDKLPGRDDGRPTRRATVSRLRPAALAAALMAAAVSGCGGDDDNTGPPAPRVMVINMFGGEAGPFISAFSLDQKHPVKGLSKVYPDVLCNSKGEICQVTTNMGYANAAATITALLYSGPFDLRRTYFIIAGIAGVDPNVGTLGSTAWADYAVDYSLSHEIDAREMPAGWPYGYFGIFTQSYDKKPGFDYRTELFQLDSALVSRAYALSKNVTLSDGADAQAFRAKYPSAPANQPPTVLRCDTASGDDWFSGTALSKRAEDWTKLLTDNQGTYCMTAQEDNSTLEVLRRGDAAGKVSYKRVLLLRAGSDMDHPHPNQTSEDALVNYGTQGGYVPATTNLVLTATPVINSIVSRWGEWSQGIPANP